MGYARCLLDRSVFIELVESGVGIGLKHALEALQMLLRMLALTVGRVGESDGGRVGRARGPVVANVGPQPSRLRRAGAGSEHRNGCVVAMQFAAENT